MTKLNSYVMFAGAMLALAGLIYGGFRLMVLVGESIPVIVKALS